jgi:hypothetical protein
VATRPDFFSKYSPLSKIRCNTIFNWALAQFLPAPTFHLPGRMVNEKKIVL